MNKPALVYHADWGSSPRKRWCSRVKLGADGRYTASEPQPVGNLNSLIKNLKAEAGEAGTVFAGFDFPIGVPVHYAKCAGIARFPEWLRELGTGAWSDFYSVCDKSEEISVHRPFYPNRSKKGCTRRHLFDGHRVADMASLLRRCELGAEGQRQACSLFWTLGGNQVGKAALIGWRDVLIPGLKQDSIRLWPFDGSLESLFKPGNTVITETYPAECYGWFDTQPVRSKADIECRKKFGLKLLSWADESNVRVESQLKTAILQGFSSGKDDAFDAVVGLFGMLQVCLEQHHSGGPDDEAIRDVEGWILGRPSPSV